MLGIISSLANELFLSLDFPKLSVSNQVSESHSQYTGIVSFLHIFHQLRNGNLIANANSLTNYFFDFLHIRNHVLWDLVTKFLTIDGFESRQLEQIVSLINFLNTNVVFKPHPCQRLAQPNHSFKLPHSNWDAVLGLGQFFMLTCVLTISDIKFLKFLRSLHSQTRIVLFTLGIVNVFFEEFKANILLNRPRDLTLMQAQYMVSYSLIVLYSVDISHHKYAVKTGENGGLELYLI